VGWDSQSNPNLEITNLSLKKIIISFQTYNAITSSDFFFFVANFTIFRKIFSERNILLDIPQQTKKISEIATIAYNMIGCLRFYTFIFLISQFF